MHYAAMAGTFFVATGAAPDLTHAVSIAAVGLAGISIVPITVLFVGLTTSAIDRLRKQETLQSELFEQAPHPFVLMERPSEASSRPNRNCAR